MASTRKTEKGGTGGQAIRFDTRWHHADQGSTAVLIRSSSQRELLNDPFWAHRKNLQT